MEKLIENFKQRGSNIVAATLRSRTPNKKGGLILKKPMAWSGSFLLLSAILVMIVCLASHCKKPVTNEVWECFPDPYVRITLTIDPIQSYIYLTTEPEDLSSYDYLFTHGGGIIPYKMRGDTIVFLTSHTAQDGTLIYGESSMAFVKTMHSPNSMTLTFTGFAIANAVRSYLFNRKTN